MANKDQFDLDIQVKPVNYSAQATKQNFNSMGCASQSCGDPMNTAMCTVTLSCKCY